MGLFRTRRTVQPVPPTPASLFRDLRRQPEVKFLWAHQERLLDDYHHHHLTTSNIALELPTGSGKTLVGLLIAEWRRRARGERVVYLCPTRQLCNQVQAQATAYGIPSVLLVGRQRDYNVRDFTGYQRAQATAITTYSGLFNINPRIDDPQVIVCDDAHAGDEYIAGLWSLQVRRRDYPACFDALVALLGEAIPETSRRRIAREDADPREQAWVDLVPMQLYRDRLGALADLLTEHTPGTEMAYPWSLLHGHLEACTIYVAPDGFLIRPIIPPTETHPPFTGARQRVFMSATLGMGGELERLTGVRAIARLPLPMGWERRGTGRRLVLFPDLLADEGACGLAVEQMLLQQPRTLVLVRENRMVEQFSGEHEDAVEIFRAPDVEHDLTPFVTAPGPAALVLANRYDGVDLPGDTCRQLALLHLPAAVNLQEKFLLERLGAVAQLRDRIRTRLTQGLGRCTRDEADYALVMLIGEDLLKWCATGANVSGLHPELQAELAFGLENSEGRMLGEFHQLQEAFFARGAEWELAEEEIANRRDNTDRASDPATARLAAAVRHELGHTYALWGHDFAHAYREALAVSDALGGDELKPYRAFWHYAAAAAADLAGHQGTDAQWTANERDHLDRAIALATGVPWLAGLRYRGSAQALITTAVAVNTAAIDALLAEWHIVGPRFERCLNRVRGQLAGTAAGPFVAGLADLGRMLGCEVQTWTENGAPDGLWLLNDGQAVIFEAKSEEDPRHPISLSTVRQVLAQPAWVEAQGAVPPGTHMHSVLIEPRTTLNPEARMVAGEIRYLDLAAIRTLFERAAAVLNTIRGRARGVADEELRALIAREYAAAGLSPTDLSGILLAMLLANVLGPN